MALRDLTQDRFTPLVFKRKALGGDDGALPVLAPSWVPEADRRRLNAYKLRRAYVDNVARWFQPDSDETKNHREYGDADLLVERVTGGLLGDEMQVVVDGADDDIPDAPKLPPKPSEPTNGEDVDRRAFDAAMARWTDRADQAVVEWEQAWTSQPALQTRQDWLREWWELEHLPEKVYEAERDGAVTLGDAVYVMGLSVAEGRPKVKIYDPGFYFPVLDENTDVDFPRKVHIAYEFNRDVNGETKKFLRRITWELVEGAAVSHPWNDGPTTDHCLMTDAEWPFDAVKGLDDLSDTAAVYMQNEDGQQVKALDIGIDFIPVVHVPGTPSTQEHFGRSVLDRVMQLLDDIAETDTDLKSAANFAAGPIITGDFTSKAEDIELNPGTAIGTKGGSRMDVLNLAGSLAPLKETIDHMRDLFSVNSQVPASLLGRIAPSEVPSGVALALSFGPFEALIRVLRMVREPKYALLLKMAQRLAQAGGFLEGGANPPARVAFGSFLPTDVSGAVDMVTKLLAAHAISRQTALQELVDAGVPIEDAADELDRIQKEDFAGADLLATATGDDQAVREYLGIPGDNPNPQQPPGPNPPPNPNAPPGTPPLPPAAGPVVTLP